ncbi:reverse transcriptase domain-containing protein [Tanacetum coccineum]
MDLKQEEIIKAKPSMEEPPELELKDLPSHLKYAYLEENDKLPVIIAKGLKDDENPWVSTVHCVPKKGGITVVANEENELIPTRLVTRWRVCIDYRKLNEATQKYHFPLPFLDQMLERLAGNEFYCFLDGFLGYFQIPIDPQDQEKTTFTCPYRTFAYRRMPFGLCNAPEKMLKRCEDTNLVLNWEKCHFMCREGIVLGHKISKSGIEVDRAKVDVIAKLPHPTTVKGVRSFLGHAGFYRRFIQDFSKIARPMTHLLEKEAPFVFSKDCIDSFQTLKKKLTEAPILVVPDWNLPFELMCDASDFAIGAVLGQRNNSFFEESNTSLSHLDHSLPEFETFSDHTEETRSGRTTTHANNSLLEYDSFLFEIEPDQGGLIGIVISDNNPLLELPEFESFHFDLDPSFPRPPPEPPDVEISLIIKTDAPVINNFDELNEDECFDPGERRLMLKMTIPSHLSFGLFSRFSLTPRFLPYFPPPKMRTPFMTPTSPLRAGGLSSGWNFHVL